MLKLHETLKEAFLDYISESKYISSACDGHIKIEDETVSFKLQAGGVVDYGKNGVQCEEMLLFVKTYIKKLNSNVPSADNIEAMIHIDRAIDALDRRTQDRVVRGVEGKEIT